MIRERFFDQRSELITALCAETVAAIAEGVAARGQASLVVTGGTTPGPLYDALSQADAPWDRTWLTLSDERWVAPDAPGSNEGLVRTRLLRSKAAGAHLVGLKTADPTPQAALPAVELALAALPRPFDKVILGMGVDGHIASLFPQARELAVACDLTRPDLACAVERAEAAGASERVSLTLRALLSSRSIAILIDGEAKRDTYRQALTAAVDATPVSALLNQHDIPLEIWWAP